MSKSASIKGSVFASSVEDVNKLICDGRLTPGEAGRWLEPGDFALLEAQISVAGWYDIRCYDRLNRLLRDVEGDGHNDYLRNKGRLTARRLLEAAYAQLSTCIAPSSQTATPRSASRPSAAISRGSTR
jgi:hypothetical protein